MEGSCFGMCFSVAILCRRALGIPSLSGWFEADGNQDLLCTCSPIADLDVAQITGHGARGINTETA